MATVLTSPGVTAGLPIEERRLARTSRAELERRWNIIRTHLVERGLQALVVQGYEEKIGGNVRWLTDVPPGYPRTIIFHADDLMTQLDHGPHGEHKRIDDRDPNRPGIGEAFTNWALQAGAFTSGLMAQDVIAVLRDRGYRDVGLVNERAMPHGFVADLKTALSGIVTFSDETDAFDLARACKSAEEITLIQRTCAIQDEVFEKLLDWIEPGVRDFELNAFLDYQHQLLGADRGVYIAASAPIDRPSTFAYRALQGRTVRRGDHINVLLESNGPSGQWAEMGRLISFGRPTDATHASHEVCVAAQAFTAGLLVPGARPAEVFAAYNDFMARHGSGPERRIHSHGQGYDAVERPFVRSDETMVLAAGMNLSIHPAFSGGTFATLCDNVLVEGATGARFLHATPKQIFEL